MFLRCYREHFQPLRNQRGSVYVNLLLCVENNLFMRGTFLNEHVGKIRVLKAYHLIFENPKVRKHIYNIKKIK